MTDTKNLSGRTAVVTGASSGIGAATARRLAAEGARVAVLGRRADRVKPLADEIGGLAAVADVTDRSSLSDAVDAVHSAYGPVDLVVANAGAMLAAPFESALVREWDQMVDTNLKGLLDTARAFVPDLLAAADAGRPADLVHISSIASHVNFPGYAVYAATKAGVTQFTRALQQEFGPRGVRVRSIEPGLTDTELGDTMADPGQAEFLRQFREQLTPIPASDVADVVAWTVAAPARVNVAELIVMPTRQG